MSEQEPSIAGAAPPAASPGRVLPSQCFLCLRQFSDDVRRTVEDVFPKWLIKFAGLSGTSSTLPTGQNFEYGQRVVPCCLECNQFLSAQLEMPVSTAMKAGYPAVQALPEETWTLWLAKLLYGTRWREQNLRVDVADPASPTLITAEILSGTMEYLRQLLLSGPQMVKFATQPASVFLYRAGIPPNTQHGFDFMIASEADLIMLRAGEVFVVAVFGENGYWKHQFADSRTDLFARSATLHPAQCVEISAVIASQAARLEWSGRWDFMYLGNGDRELPAGLTRVFSSRFVPSERTDAIPRLRRELVGTIYGRGLGQTPPADLLELATNTGSYPTLLRNPHTDTYVQAQCFEPACPALPLAAGWILEPDGPACPSCGSTGQN